MFIGFLLEREWLEPVTLVRDDGCRAALFEERAEPFAIISLVRQQFLRGRKFGDKRFGNDAVINVAACQQECYRPAFAVRERVDFGGAAAPADAERLTPFLPCAARWALIAVESMLFS